MVPTAFQWTIDEHVDIISVSWGVRSTVQAIEQIINRAMDEGIIILAALGAPILTSLFPLRPMCFACGRGFNPPHHNVMEKDSAVGQEIVAASFYKTLDAGVHEERQARSGSSIA